MHAQDPGLVEALAHTCAMTIPAHEADGTLVRPARTGPVFRFLDHPPKLHVRYTARTRSISWRSDIATTRAVAALETAIASLSTHHVQVRFKAGEGRDLQQRAAPQGGVRRRRGLEPDGAEDPFVRPGLERVAPSVAPWKRGSTGHVRYIVVSCKTSRTYGATAHAASRQQFPPGPKTSTESPRPDARTAGGPRNPDDPVVSGTLAELPASRQPPCFANACLI